MTDTPPVRKIPAGVRALPTPVKPPKPARVLAETCGRGDIVPRRPHLDELDGESV